MPMTVQLLPSLTSISYKLPSETTLTSCIDLQTRLLPHRASPLDQPMNWQQIN